MSQTIDQRIVEMRFDNQQFESGVKTSLGTLDRLKNATKISGNTKVFDGLEKAVGKLNFDGLNSAVQTVSDRFSAFEAIGVGALMRIGSQAVDAGEKLIKSLSIDNISSGWQKFGEKTTSVGTLLAQGFDMADVEKTMDRLNWFTDETSYNLTDMIGNISKFTATGKNLDDSATAMQGIALWAALSGQNASTASRAMYQLSQAMSVGALRQEDYKSIQNASMDTKEFREQALKAAIALGKVKEAEDGIYKIGNKEFTFAELFTSDALTRTRWLDSDVMMKTFKSYSAAVDSIYEAVQAGDFDTASEAIEKLGGQLDAFGVKAFKAGQEARTWGDVLDSVKDAVGTGWMKTFEMIFGNYEEATKFFTEMANGLWEIFASGGEARNELLRVWKALGGRTELLAGLKFAIVDLLYAVRPLTEAFSEIFPPATAQQLVDLAKKFSYLMQNARYTQSTFDKLKTIFKGVFTIIKTGINVVRAFLDGLSPLFQLVAIGVNEFLTLAASVSELIMQYANGLETSGAFAQITDTVRTVILVLIGVVLTAVNAITSFVDKVRGFINVFREFNGGASAIAEYVNSLQGVDKAAAMVALTLGALVKIVGMVADAFVSTIRKIASFITSLGSIGPATNVFDKLREKFAFLKPAIDIAEKAIGVLVKAIKSLPETIASLPDKFAAMGKTISNVFSKSGSLLQNADFTNTVFNNLKKIFESVFKTVKSGTKTVGAFLKNISPLFQKVSEGVNGFLSLTSSVGELIVQYAKGLDAGGAFADVIDKVQTVVFTLVGVVLKAASAIVSFANKVRSLLGSFRTFEGGTKSIAEYVNSLHGADKVAATVAVTLRSLSKIIEMVGGAFIAAVGKISSFVTNLTKVDSTTSVFDKLREKFEFLKPAIDVAEKAIGVLAEAIKNLPGTIATLPDKFAALGTSIAGIFGKLNLEGVKTFGELFDKAKKAVSDFFGSFKDTDKIEQAKTKIDALKTSIIQIVDTIKDKLSKVDPAALIAFAFGTAITIAVLNLAGLLTKMEHVVQKVLDLQTVLNDIAIMVQKKIKGNAITSTITKVATAMTMLAGSLWLVAQVPTERLIPAAIALGLLGAEMVALVAAFELLNKHDLLGSSNKFSLAMVSFGAGVALLAVAVNLLKDVKLDENLVARLITIAALMAEIGIAAALLGKFAPSLSKGALFFVGFAAAVTLLVKALVDIAKQPMGDIQNSLDVITQIMIDVSLLTLAASRLHFGSSVALLIAIGDIVLIEKALMWIGKSGVDLDFVQKNISKFHVIIGAFMGLATVLALASAVGKNMALASAGIALGAGALIIVEQAIIRLCDPKLDFVGTEHFLSNLVVVFGSLIVVAGIAVAAAHFAGDATTGIVKVVAMVAGISLVMLVMVELLKAIAAIDDPSKLDKAIVALFAVSVMASILVAVTALTAKAKFQPIIAMVAAVGVIIAGLALLSYVKGDLVTAAEALGGVLVALAVAMAAAGKMSEKMNVAGIIAMTAAVGVIAISLNVLAQQDWFALIAAAASLGIVLLSIGGALKLAKDSGDAAFSALAMAATVVAVAASLSMLADKPWSGLIAAAVAMGIVFATMSAALLMVGDEFSKGVFNLWALCVPLLAATLALSVLADYSWDSLIAAAAALAIVMVSLGLASKLATGSLEGAAAMFILSVAVIAIAAAFKILETVNFEALVPNLVALCATLAVLVGLGALANMVAPGLIALSVAVLAIGAATLMFGNGALMVAEAADKMLDVLIRLSNEGPAAVQKLAQAFLDFVNNTVGKFVSGISDMATKALSSVSDFLTKMISAVAAKVAPFGQSAGKLMMSFISGIQGKVSNAINVISKCVASMLNAITTKAKSFFSAAQTLITNVYNGIASKVNEVITTVSNMVGQAKASIDNKVKEFETAARDVVQGFVDGITSKFEEVKNAALNFGNKFMEGIRNGLQWHSPPAWINVFGGDTVKGLFDMASSLAGQMQGAGEALLQPYVNGARGKLAEVEDIMNVVNSLGLEGYGNNEMTNPTDWQRQRQVAAGNARRGEHKKPGERHGGGNGDGGVGSGGVGSGGGGGGGSAKEEESELDKLTAKLKDNIDAFSKYENKIGVTGKALLKNLGSWSTGMEGWADRIKFLASEGIDKGLLQKLIDAGPQGAEYVNAFISMTSEELAEAGKAYNESMEAPAKVAQDILALYDENAQKVTEATTTAVEKNVELGESVTDTAKKLGETAEVYSEAVEKPAEAATGVLSSYAEVSGKAAEILDEAITKNKDLVDSVALSTEATESQLKRAQFAYENMRDSLKETIDSQMDIFSEFKTDTELTSDQLIKNMESQLNGVTTWSDELNGLISRGIDEGLLQNLAQMGPKGYEYVHAFSQMTDEELSHASELYRNSLTISDEVSRDIAGKWAAAGLNATLGYKQGIASANANEEAATVGNNSVSSLMSATDENSPSRKTYQIGVYFVQGFVNGIRESYATATGEITSFAETCIGLLKIYFAPEKFQELGSNIGTGIQNGLNEAITAISTAFDAGGILESYGTLGQNIIQGIITGMSAKTAEAVTTVQTMMTNVNTAITGFNPQLNASGVGLITQLNAGMVSLQATVIATGNTIITQTKQKIDSFKQPYFNSGRDLIQKVIDGFKNRKSTVVNTADDITKSADQKINSYQNTYLQTGETLIEKLRTGVANKQQNVVTTADTLVKAALKAITDTYNDWYAAGQYIIQGLDAGISSMEHIIFEHLQRIAAEAIAAAEEECEIESPSKAFFRIGKFIDLGWVNGIDAYADKVTGAASGLAHNALYTVRDAFSNMASIVSDDISLDPTIRPVLDLTDVENGLTGVDAMLAAQRSLSMSIGGINEEGLRQNRPYVIYLNTSTNLDGQVIATSMDTILGEAL